MSDATEAQIQMATGDFYPRVFRRCTCVPYHGGLRHPDAADYATSFWTSLVKIGKKIGCCALYAIPLPWIAIESGWLWRSTAVEPWAIGEVLPTAVSELQPDRGRPDLSRWC
ncbi:cytochrome ubiquinol oxidase subunit I [Shigella flexneri]